jgi:rRNA maturation endonuclease Nob1
MANPEIVRTRTTRYEITNVEIDFLTFNENFRRVRANRKYQGFQCFNCNHKFEDGEKMSLIFTNKGNKTVCHKCGDLFDKGLREEFIRREAGM